MIWCQALNLVSHSVNALPALDRVLVMPRTLLYMEGDFQCFKPNSTCVGGRDGASADMESISIKGNDKCL